MDNGNPIENNPQQTVVSKQTGSKKLFWILPGISVIVLLFLVVAAFSYLNVFSLLGLSTNEPAKTTIAESSLTQQNFSIPVSPSNEYVTHASIAYSFNVALISDVREDNGIVKFTLSSPDSSIHIPNVGFSENARISGSTSTGSASLLELQNIKLSVRALYDLITSEWTVSNITVQPKPQTPQQGPRSQTQQGSRPQTQQSPPPQQ